MTEKKTFSWVKLWLLSIVTCGIYGIYAWYKMTETNNEIAEKLGEEKIKGFIVACLLGIITCGIYLIYWYYKFADQQIKIAQKSGVAVAPTDNAIVYMILLFVPIYSYYVLCDNYNRTVEAN